MTVLLRTIAAVAVALLGVAGCATPDPAPPPPEAVARPRTRQATPAPTVTRRVVTPRPETRRRRGVTSDPGSRYLAHGVTGAVAVETPPEAPAVVSGPVSEVDTAPEPGPTPPPPAATPEGTLGTPPTGPLPGTR